MLNNKILVVAGNIHEYECWITEYKLDRDDYDYISNPNQLFGLERGFKYIKIGEYHNHFYVDDILKNLKRRGGIEIKGFPEENKFTFECTDCGFVGEIYEFGYIGPKDRGDNQCHPFMEIIEICNECEEKRKGKNEKAQKQTN